MATAVMPTSDVSALREREAKPQMPRILFLIDEIGSIADGGTERQVLQLIQLAKRLGYEPRLAVLRGTGWLQEDSAGCPVYTVGVQSFFRTSGLRPCLDLIRWMRRERIELVQTFFIECNIVGPWLARLAGVPVVIGSRRNLNEWMKPWTRLIQRLANRSADCIVANSHEAAEAMTKTERVPSHKLRVAYNGIELAKFSELDRQRSRTRKILGIGDGEILVGNISGMRPVKGLLQFVDAARIALEKDPSMRFVIVGDGSERPLIEERIRAHGIGGRVHLAGAQTDVLPYLAAMDIGVLSSLAEGFSNSLLEYMASGLAAVVTDVGGNREALENTGILVPPDDPAALAEGILRLREPGLRQQFGHAARERVARFSLARAEQCMEQLYSELLNSKRNLQRKN
jgi:L-malate glycosyltransferase